MIEFANRGAVAVLTPRLRLMPRGGRKEQALRNQATAVSSHV
jgi:hypothetical protein